MFHPALAGSFLWVPDANGALAKIKTSSGKVVKSYPPFKGAGANVTVTSPVTVGPDGNLYYTATSWADRLNPLDDNCLGSWVRRPGGWSC